MKRLTVRSRALVGTAALCLVSVLRLPAKSTAPATGAKTENTDETIVLSPFVVDASSDADGYTAKSTLAGTRVRTDLRDVASAISVVTAQFLQGHRREKLGRPARLHAQHRGRAGIRGNFSGVGGTGIYQENTISNIDPRARSMDSGG